MKKIIALALALIMALSMGVVAFAAATPAVAAELMIVTDADGVANVGKVAPGTIFEISPDFTEANKVFDGAKITKVDFTTGDLCGASLIDSVKITKEKDCIRVTLKESYTMAEETDKVAKGVIYFVPKGGDSKNPMGIVVNFSVNNGNTTVDGARKADEATVLASKADFVNVVEEAGYFTFTDDQLKGTFKAAKGDKIYLNSGVDLKKADADEYDALVAAFGEDYDGIVEMYTFETKAAEDVAFTYEAWAEDPHFFYAWDGEKLTQIEAKFDADEDVDAYVFTADAAGTIVICDEEVVLAAEETKNPDTGANDVVGVAAALAVVSLVAAGAVSLKK